MDNSLRSSYMAVFAVSGSVVLLALRVHKHLMSDFMKKIDFEFGMKKGDQSKKKVRFAEEVEELPSENTAGSGDAHHPRHYEIKHGVVSGCRKRDVDGERFQSMPENWQALYKGIIQARALKRSI